MAVPGRADSAGSGRSSNQPRPDFTGREKSLFRSAAITTLAGLIAGFVVGGIGSRVAMRIVAVVAGPSADGRITQFGAVVGHLTPQGTLFLMFLGAMLGIPPAIFYMAVRRWIPSAPTKGLTFGAILLLILGSVFIEASNPDFARFGPRLLNMILFATLPIVYGLLLVKLVGRFERTFPAVSRKITVLVPYAVLSILFFIGLALAFTVRSFSSSGPSLSIITLIFLAPMAYRLFVLSIAANSNMFRHRYVLYGGYTVLAISCIIGFTQLSRAIYQILSAVV